jgi:hypothetical protein
LKEIEDTKRIFSKDRVFVAQRDDWHVTYFFSWQE